MITHHLRCVMVTWSGSDNVNLLQFYRLALKTHTWSGNRFTSSDYIHQHRKQWAVCAVKQIVSMLYSLRWWWKGDWNKYKNHKIMSLLLLLTLFKNDGSAQVENCDYTTQLHFTGRCRKWTCMFSKLSLEKTHLNEAYSAFFCLVFRLSHGTI